ncbi:amidase signature enzyme [Auriscalpium vulgare]|uniref:Amidase signature enzyme n=1 Tax=Auriscalpium vulgare TaxID=40419 RepID=A0ACB8RFA7_9AGAM|nr:amidase signature enzyme [Auriscalpium vulgare]
MFSYFAHWRACRAKQLEREERIKALPPDYHSAITANDAAILHQSVAALAESVRSGVVDPQHILVAYGKKALQAHSATNCLTEVMISKAEIWAQECNKQGPLAGVPVSMKDTVGVAGFDSCIGYSAWVGKPFQQDAALVKLLRDAGAVPFVKTNIPTTLLSFESVSDVWGRTTNPHSKEHSPGGSTGGEAALLAFGGSRLGVGTDVAGSVRVPAHYSGIFTIKASMSRFLKAGNASGMVGQEGIPPVYSPMTRTLEDLETFWRAVISMKPWDYDPSCAPIPWRSIELPQVLKIGVLWDDGVVQPSPACRRALEQVVSLLKAEGHNVISIEPPSPFEALKIGSQLMANACIAATSHIGWWESNDPGIARGVFALRLPRFLNRLHAWFRRYILRDPLYAELIESWHVQGGQEFYALIGKREEYRGRWLEYWQKEGFDFILTVPNALPAMKHRDSKLQWKSCGYTFLFNVLDYSAGVMPITHVDRALDALSPNFKARNGVEAGAFEGYDADEMHGLPIGVQLVARRLEEEKVLEGLKIIQGLARKNGSGYVHTDF